MSLALMIISFLIEIVRIIIDELEVNIRGCSHKMYMHIQLL